MDSVEAVGLMLQQHPEWLDARSPDGHRPVIIAAYYNAPEVLDLLAEATEHLTLFEAAAAGREDIVAARLRSAPAMVHGYSPDGFTALHLAAFFGHRDIVLSLIQHGADINAVATNPMHVTPLHSALAHHHTDIVQQLLLAGADVNSAQHGGWTPLHQAAKDGDLVLIRQLLQHGADARLTREDGMTPADLAREEGHHDAAQELERAAETPRA